MYNFPCNLQDERGYFTVPTTKNLQNYHLDPKKSGMILKTWIKDAGYSYSDVAEETGFSLDTINNSLAGKVADPRLERVFKIAVLTGHSVCEYLQLMLEDEDIDFADRVHVLRADEDMHLRPLATAPQVSHASSEHNLSEAEMNSILDRFRRVYESVINQLRDQIAQIKESRQIMKEQYEQQLQKMEEQHRIHDETLAETHREAMGLLREENDRLRRANRWKTIALSVETVAVVALTLIDAFNTDIGWYRGLVQHLYPEGKHFSLKG